MSATSLDLIDMNGDGLPDSVSKVAGSNSLSVVLGLGAVGIADHRQFQYATNVWPMEPLSANLSQSNQLTFAAESADALRVQDTSSNSLQINIMGIGGGVAFGASRSMVDMIDINGDGLPDRVLKQPGRDELLV